MLLFYITENIILIPPLATANTSSIRKIMDNFTCDLGCFDKSVTPKKYSFQVTCNYVGSIKFSSINRVYLFYRNYSYIF